MSFITSHRMLFTKVPKESSVTNITPRAFRLMFTQLGVLTGCQRKSTAPHWQVPQRKPRGHVVSKFGFIPKPTLGPYLNSLLFLPSFPYFLTYAILLASCLRSILKQDKIASQSGNYFHFLFNICFNSIWLKIYRNPPPHTSPTHVPGTREIKWACSPPALMAHPSSRETEK